MPWSSPLRRRSRGCSTLCPTDDAALRRALLARVGVAIGRVTGSGARERGARPPTPCRSSRRRRPWSNALVASFSRAADAHGGAHALSVCSARIARWTMRPRDARRSTPCTSPRGRASSTSPAGTCRSSTRACIDEHLAVRTRGRALRRLPHGRGRRCAVREALAFLQRLTTQRRGAPRARARRTTPRLTTDQRQRSSTTCSSTAWPTTTTCSSSTRRTRPRTCAWIARARRAASTCEVQDDSDAGR